MSITTVSSDEWNALKAEFLTLKERINKSPMIRWSIYELHLHEIQGAQATHFMFHQDFESLDDLSEYVLTNETMMEEAILVLKEYVYADGIRRYVGGTKLDNYSTVIRHPSSHVYNGKEIDGFVKQKNKMRFIHIKEFDTEPEEDHAIAIIGDESQNFSLFPEEDEGDEEADEEEVEEEEEDTESKEEAKEDDDESYEESEAEDEEFDYTLNILLKKEV